MSYAAILKNRAFVGLWLGESVSALGDRINTLGLVLLVYELTGSGLAVGTFSLVQAVPALVLGLMAGAVVDRYPRTAVLIVSNVLRGLLILTLPLAGGMTHIYIVAFALSSAGAFFNPALQATLPAVVGASDLLAANGLLKLSRETMLMAGAAAGGVLVARLGAPAAFVFNALTFFFAAGCVGFIARAAPSPPLPTADAPRVIWGEIAEGVRFVRGHPALLRLQGIAVLFALASGMTGPLVVVLVKERLGLEAQGFGLVLAAMSAGALAGAALAGRLSGRLSHGQLLAAALGSYCIALLGAAGATGTIPALAFFGLYGLAGVVGGLGYQTAAQAMAPDSLRGRILSSLGVAYTLASLAAFVLGGWLSDRLGTPAVFGLAGLLSLAAAAWLIVGMLHERRAAYAGGSR